MRTIDEIILHTDGPEDDHGNPVAGTDHSAATIRVWHVEHNGWSDIGYHRVIRKDGTIENGRPISQVGSHAKTGGHNQNSIGIVVTGHGDIEPWTPEQIAAVVRTCRCFMSSFNIPVDRVIGHGEIPGVTKSCPGGMVDMDEIRRLIAGCEPA